MRARTLIFVFCLFTMTYKSALSTARASAPTEDASAEYVRTLQVIEQARALGDDDLADALLASLAETRADTFPRSSAGGSDPRPTFSDALRDKTREAHERYQAYYAASPDVNVHTANAACLRGLYAMLGPLDSELVESTIPHSVVLGQLAEAILPEHATQFAASRRLLEGHLATQTVDAETGANVALLLARTTQLASLVPDSHQFAYSMAGPRMNALQYLAWSMSENTETGGGCFPGFAGRLIRDYIEFLGILCAR